ncbi:MAG: sulfatase [Limisphaerales bacterium]|nr:MAG: sulfatase [Limisphaerales bacterium]KAG0507855.1 MAG: sulfatase [Limisphaerales bacterium]TXT48663.1 MAG: sulfatase [Limisphaerales bacterium]
MKLRLFFSALLCALCVFALNLFAATKPNVLLLCVDDLKPALGCYGDPLAKSPNIDRVAARGMRFDLAFCNQSVCAPSRNNLLLGSRSTSLGIYSLNRNFRDAVPDAVTMTQHFMRHGYRAEAVGKILHTGHGNRDDDASWSVPSVKEKVVEYLDPRNSANGQLTREEAFFTNQRLGEISKLPRGAATEISDVPDSAYADGRIADEGIQRLRAAKERGTPFFLALGFVKPHLPLTAPKKYFDLHDPAKFALASDQRDPEGAPKYAGKVGGEIVNYDPLSVENLLEEKTQRELIHAYYACVSYMDAQLGRVLDELDRLGLAQSTLIVLWGDHGWHLGDHGYWTKHTNYEQANRTPLLIVAPGVTRPGSATRQPAETVDVFPTLAELAGLPAPAGPQPRDGLSLVPVLRDPARRIRDHAYHAYPRGERMGRAIRTERYRLVEWKKPGAPADAAEFELYDYETDPRETKNLAAAQPAVVAQLRGILARHPEAVPPGGSPAGKAKR